MGWSKPRQPTVRTERMPCLGAGSREAPGRAAGGGGVGGHQLGDGPGDPGGAEAGSQPAAIRSLRSWPLDGLGNQKEVETDKLPT